MKSYFVPTDMNAKCDNDDEYKGAFQNSKPHGEGTMKYHNGQMSMLVNLKMMSRME